MRYSSGAGGHMGRYFLCRGMKLDARLYEKYDIEFQHNHGAYSTSYSQAIRELDQLAVKQGIPCKRGSDMLIRSIPECAEHPGVMIHQTPCAQCMSPVARRRIEALEQALAELDAKYTALETKFHATMDALSTLKSLQDAKVVV